MKSQLEIAKQMNTDTKFTSSREELSEFIKSRVCADLVTLFYERSVAFKLYIADNDTDDISVINQLRGYAKAQADIPDILEQLVELFDTVKDDENLKKED